MAWCCVQDDKSTSKGFGFVNFEDPDAAQRAVETINDMEVDGKAIFAGRAQKKSEREASLKAKCGPPGTCPKPCYSCHQGCVLRVCLGSRSAEEVRARGLPEGQVRPATRPKPWCCR